MDFNGEHLWWDLTGIESSTIVCGEITVLATTPGTYFCGANWHPGEPAGGYCGIQDNSSTELRTIFSIWDTTDKLHPQITEVGPMTVFNRFGGEGTGAHTHMLLNWQLSETFYFITKKSPNNANDTTDARYYIFHPASKAWDHIATIQSPNGGFTCVKTIGGGGLASFLENFTGENKALPRLALYRLWVGTDANTMNPLTKANGDGAWGVMHDAYFLVQGSRANVEPVFRSLEVQYGRPVFAGSGHTLSNLSPRTIPTTIRAALNNLPRAPPMH